MCAELIEALERILSKSSVTIPIDIALWSGDDIAVYLRRDKRTVMERLVYLPDFPKVIRLPFSSGGRGQPLWVAKEAIEWAKSLCASA